VSTTRFLGLVFFSASLHAQFSNAPSVSVSGELRSHGDIASNDLLVEVYDSRTNSVVQRVPVSRGQFELDRVPVGSYSVRLVTAPGEPPIVEELHQFEPGGGPLILDLPERVNARPISGIVSLRELEHPIPKKALREAYEGQQLAHDHDFAKAIAKFEKAIQIDPTYRDAHLNLGVQYARVGRTAEAHAEFQKALDIGPPAAPIYANLALISIALGRLPEAETFAHEALKLDANNSAAQRVLQNAFTH
jgi:tetratricopeptide (TPR) repeat protein